MALGPWVTYSPPSVWGLSYCPKILRYPNVSPLGPHDFVEAGRLSPSEIDNLDNHLRTASGNTEEFPVYECQICGMQFWQGSAGSLDGALKYCSLIRETCADTLVCLIMRS
jgi:hypothetical protein